MSQSSTKRLSPERIAEIRANAVEYPELYGADLRGHIDAIEAELKHTIAAWHDSQNELAEAKAEIARLRAHCENYP